MSQLAGSGSESFHKVATLSAGPRWRSFQQQFSVSDENFVFNLSPPQGNLACNVFSWVSSTGWAAASGTRDGPWDKASRGQMLTDASISWSPQSSGLPIKIFSFDSL